MSIHSNSISESENEDGDDFNMENKSNKITPRDAHIADLDEMKFKLNINKVAMDRETLPLHYLLEELHRNPDL